MTDLPEAVIAVDPDSQHTALAWAHKYADREAYYFAGVKGGGSLKSDWQSITGARSVLCDLSEQPVTVIETQPAISPRSADVEALRRVRYHWDAACELLSLECVHVSPSKWQASFTKGAGVSHLGRGAIKRAYQERAKLMTNGETKNEDQCAAFGMLHWYITDVLGTSIICHT